MYSNIHLIAFLISFIIGEEGILFLAFLSGGKVISFWAVFAYSIAGIIMMDAIVFYFGSHKTILSLRQRLRASEKARKLSLFIRETAGKNMLLSLMLTKFIYGSRVISIVYFSSSGAKFWKFLAFDFIAVFIWSCIMIPLGWLAGLNFGFSLQGVKSAERVISIGLIFFIILIIINKIIQNAIVRKESH